MSDEFSERKRKIKINNIAVIISLLVLGIAINLTIYFYSEENFFWKIFLGISIISLIISFALLIYYPFIGKETEPNEIINELIEEEKERHTTPETSQIRHSSRSYSSGTPQNIPSRKEPKVKQKILILERRKFRNQDRDFLCMICKLQIRDGQTIYVCPQCNSHFHEKHLKEWIEIEDKSPLCGYIIIRKI